MTGNFKFKLISKRVCYEFMVYRKIMRITGESASGKSELIRQLLLAENPRTGVIVNCKYPCRVLNNDRFQAIKKVIKAVDEKIKNHESEAYRETMKESLKEYKNILFFADEDFDELASELFAKFCKFTDSFFVLICRDYLAKLPYSYTEIYRIKKSGKFHYLENLYQYESFQKLADNNEHLYITEDSNAGFEFFQKFYNHVETSEGKSKFYKKIESVTGDVTVNMIADGAAFGAEIEKLLKKIEALGKKVCVFLPESFEYLVLTSELFRMDDISNNMEELAGIIDGTYFSWEQYFNDKLEMLTKNCTNEYSKKKINTCYILPCCHKSRQKCNIMQNTDKKRAVLGKYYE